MKIAVATSDYRKVSGHAGQVRRWIIYEARDAGPPVEVQRLELAPEMVFHHYRESQGPHPLDGIHVLIFQTAGDNFLRRMEKKGYQIGLTAETNPAKAAADYAAGTLKEPRPPGMMSVLCKIRDLLPGGHARDGE